MRICRKCGIKKSLNEFHKDKKATEGHSQRCKECARRHTREWNAMNREKKRRTNRAWDAENIDRVRSYTEEYRTQKKDRYKTLERERAKKNSAQIVEKVRRWRAAHPVRNSIQKRRDAANRRARLKMAYPSWADKEKIAAIYAEADRITRETGIPHEVDHIFPLAGRLSCGLHVHQNLQILTASQNRKKSYKEYEEWPARLIR